MCGRNKGGWVRGLLAERAVTTPRCGLSPSGKSSAQLLLRALPLAPDLLQGWEAAPRPRGAALISLTGPVGEPPTWLQLPTTQDRGDPRREMFNPESKLLGRPLGRSHRARQSCWP